MLAFGEIHTALLQNSTALPRDSTRQLLDLVDGEPVRWSDRPIAFAASPDQLEGIDCRLPTRSGTRSRGVGTLSSRATVIGGHVAQGSTYATVVPSSVTRRLPWSHYLANPGRIETIGRRAKQSDLIEGILAPSLDPAALDLAAVAGRMLDTVQRSPLLDRTPPLRAPRLRLRWVAIMEESPQTTGSFTVASDDLRTVELHIPHNDLTAVVSLCEDLAMHDWLLTTLLSLLESVLTRDSGRTVRISRLRPVFDHLLHLWMPAARVPDQLRPVWVALEEHPGFSRQWNASVARVRDQVTLSTLAMLQSPCE